MPAPNKNQFWKLRDSHGRDRKYSSAEELWAASCAYFEWCDRHPLKEQKVFGTGLRMTVNHPQAYTIKALCFFLGIGASTWNDWKNKPEYEGFSAIIETIEQVTYSQKFNGAAVSLFNANLISRELGLADKTEIDFSKLSDRELDEVISRLQNPRQ